MDNEEAPQSKKIKLDSMVNQDKDGLMDFSEDVIGTQDDDFMVRDDIYSNYPNPEELEKLREFKVLDEVKSNDEDSQEESDSSDGKSEGLPVEEIEKMLDEDLPDELKAVPKPKEKPYVTRQKIVLEEKGVNHLEVLPLDWIMARHYSGMPVYIHRTSRVCTLSKPYFLGKGNTRRHDIPISAIPCLAYRKALEEEAKQEEIDRNIQEQIKDGTWKHYTPKTELVVKENETKKEINNMKDDKTCETDKIDKFDETNAANASENEKPKCPFSHENLVQFTTQNIDDNLKESNVANASENEKPKCPFSHENLVQFTTNETNADKIVDKNSIVNDALTEEDQTVGENGDNLENGDVKEDSRKDTTAVTNLDDIPLNRRPVVLPGGIVMPPPRVETVNDSWKTQHLNHEQVNDYCKKLFKFKVVNIMHFNRWADRRKYTKARKTLQYPTLPEGTKLITIPAQNGQDGTGKAAKRDWVMNMNGRSCLSVFHEYVRRALQKQPVYEFKQLENASCPYQASVYIGGMQYGVGRGSSKRQAKSHAARHAFHVLLPTLQAHEPPQPREPDFTFFDYVGIEDPRISEFCAATCEPSPHAILRTCLLRNLGAGDRHIHTDMKKLEYQKIELTMSVGKHKATVVCKNKKTAKQRASQAILQALHPHVTSWGSLLRLYGSRSVKSCKEKKLEEQQITLLQDKAQHNEPNYAVLDKLRTEMRRLKERDAAIVPIGTLLLQHDLPSHSGSNLNNVDL